MKAKKLLIAAGILGLIIGVPLAGNAEEKLTAREILIRSDAVINAPQDREIIAEIIINEEGRRERKRTVRIWQKGEKGILMFLYPNRLRRTAILTLPDNVTYAYLPIWRKAERISLEEMEGDADFLGTGFTPADMKALIIRIDDFDPMLLESEKFQGLDHYHLELKIKEGIETDYPTLRVWIRKDKFYPVMIEQYNREGELQRVVKTDKWEKIDGHWFPRISTISDIKREREIEIRATIVIFDQELENELFTPRKLRRLHRIELPKRSPPNSGNSP